MSYSTAQIRGLREEIRSLKPAVRLHDIKTYEKKRDDVVISFLPHATHTTRMMEKAWYKKALNDNKYHLETVLYGQIWDDLLPNERLAMEHVYYENQSLVGSDTHVYKNVHDYVAAKRSGHKNLAKQHLKNTLWEILHNSPAAARNEREYDKAQRRRRAQAAMFNSLNTPDVDIHTPAYITEPIRDHYLNTELEALLPNIAFPLEDSARLIAEEIQQINADTLQQLMGHKSLIAQSHTVPEATEAFVALYINIVEDGTRTLIDKALHTLARQGKTGAEIEDSLHQALQRYQDVTIPRRIEMLSLHFNGKLSEVNQREEGKYQYVWIAMDDEKTRPSHAANNGKVFSWLNPPPTGHPGEAYNCRCYAAPWPPSSAHLDPNNGRAEPADFLLLPALAVRRAVVGAAASIGRAVRRVFKDPISKRPKGVPKDWKKFPSNKNEG